MPFSTLQEAPLRLHPWSRVTNLGNAVMFESNRAEYGGGIGYSSPEATEINGIRGEERELGRFCLNYASSPFVKGYPPAFAAKTSLQAEF